MTDRRIAAIVSLVFALATAGCAAPAPSVAPTPVAPTAFPTAAVAGSPAPAGTSPASTPTASSSPSSEVGWRLVQLPEASDVVQVADVISASGHIVVIAAAGSGDERAAAWASTDKGATWTSESIPGTGQALGRMVAWGDRIIAIGASEGAGECAHPSTVDIRVRDADGTWATAPFDPLFCAGGLPGAATSGQHAVIVGSGTGDVAYAWSSDDGLHWTDRSEVFANRLPAGVVADGSGFVVFGTGLAPAPAWTTRSADGTSWQPPQPISGLAEATAIANPVTFDGAPAMFVADPSGAVGILRPDGQGGWRSEPCQGLSRDSLSRVVAVDGRLVGLGADEGGPLAWISADGVTWRPLALPPEATASGANAALTGAAIADGRAYLTGQIATPADARALGALWTGPASLLQP